MPALYDTIGTGYAALRRPDPSINQAILNALGDADTIVNVGAGSGSYEPADRSVLAIELSTTMIAQRVAGAAPVVQASAMSLPFRSNTFDAALAVLTVHHWSDIALGLSELRRVARDRVVILSWDPAHTGFWLKDYIAGIHDIDRPMFPPLCEYEQALGPLQAIAVPLPHDCRDGFLCAYWRRPAAYLDPRVRSAISTFSKLGNISSQLQRLQQDLESGEWHRRYAGILDQEEMDLGYRLLVTDWDVAAKTGDPSWFSDGRNLEQP